MTMNLINKKISIIGFGNQGIAWAQNMRDSGLNVRIALKAGSKSMGKASELGFEIINIKTAFIHSDIVCLLTPDETHREIIEKYHEEIEDGQAIVFAHGFNIHYKLINIEKKVDIVLCSPKGTGKSLRELYSRDLGVPCLISADKDISGKAWEIAKSLAESLGCHKAGIHKSTFKEETEINLFTEQALYFSIIPESILETFRILEENGYSKDAAYYETLHKLKTISDLYYKYGLTEAFQMVSTIARSGGMLSKGRVFNDNSKKEMKKILKEIQDGTFIKKLDEELSSGNSKTKQNISDLKESSLERTGKLMRERLFKNERKQ